MVHQRIELRWPARQRWAQTLLVVVWLWTVPAQAAGQPPLPSWNDGAAKTAILDFVRRVTQQGSREFVPPAERIAVFDNDGTLWSEQPIYFQFAFAVDRVKALAPQHPEWKTTQPFKAVLDGDTKALVASGEKGLAEVILATHTGMTTDTFVTKFELRPDSTPVLVREPKIDFIDDGPGKPVGISKFIGRRPVLAFGNSDGDQQMLEWTNARPGARFMGLVHHTDSTREWAYDRQSHIGKLDKALDEATARRWTVVDMKRDWKVIYPFQR